MWSIYDELSAVSLHQACSTLIVTMEEALPHGLDTGLAVAIRYVSALASRTS